MDEYRELLAHDFALPPEDDNVRRGVVFAASGMRCATSGPKRLPGANIDLTVLAGPRASLLDLHPLVGPTIAARPSFVVVHSSILALAPRSPVKKAFTVARTFWDRQAGVFIQSFVRDDLSGRDDTRASKRLVPVFPCLPNAVPVGLWRDQTGQAIRKRALAGRQRAKMRALLHRFTEAGIPVLIASAPANEFTEPYFAMVNDGHGRLLARPRTRRESFSWNLQGFGPMGSSPTPCTWIRTKPSLIAYG